MLNSNDEIGSKKEDITDNIKYIVDTLRPNRGMLKVSKEGIVQVPSKRNSIFYSIALQIARRI